MILQAKAVSDNSNKSDTITSSDHGSLNMVCKSGIVELKSFATPPQAVEEVLTCIAVLLGQQDVSWRAIKKMLGDSNFLNKLVKLDQNSVTPQQAETVASFSLCHLKLTLYSGVPSNQLLLTHKHE